MATSTYYPASGNVSPSPELVGSIMQGGPTTSSSQATHTSRTYTLDTASVYAAICDVRTRTTPTSSSSAVGTGSSLFALQTFAYDGTAWQKSGVNIDSTYYSSSISGSSLTLTAKAPYSKHTTVRLMKIARR